MNQQTGEFKNLDLNTEKTVYNTNTTAQAINDQTALLMEGSVTENFQFTQNIPHCSCTNGFHMKK